MARSNGSPRSTTKRSANTCTVAHQLCKTIAGRAIAGNPSDFAGPSAGVRRNFVYNFRLMLRFLTAGESHGRALVVILEGLPAGLPIDPDALTRDLRRRQLGYGRGRRMAIESDRAEILSGVRAGETLGGPVAMLIENRDWPNWQQTMHVQATVPPDATGARRSPGHATASRARGPGRRRQVHGRDDLRDILERASARETAARVAAGGLARQLLLRAGVQIASHVYRIGHVVFNDHLQVTFADAAALSDDAPLRCVDPDDRAADDRRDRSRARGGRHARRRVRSDRDERADRPRQLCAMGPQAGWTPRAGADVDPGDQGRRSRDRTRGGCVAGLARPR